MWHTKILLELCTGRFALALSHLYSGKRTVQGKTGEVAVEAAAGSSVRVRLINT